MDEWADRGFGPKIKMLTRWRKSALEPKWHPWFERHLVDTHFPRGFNGQVIRQMTGPRVGGIVYSMKTRITASIVWGHSFLGLVGQTALVLDWPTKQPHLLKSPWYVCLAS